MMIWLRHPPNQVQEETSTHGVFVKAKGRKGKDTMRRKSPVALIGGSGLLVLFFGAALAFSGSAGARGSPAASSSLGAGPTVVSYPPGVPAIQPRASLQSQGGPAFTADDVTVYIQTQSFIRTTSGAVPTITQITFMTAQQASALLQGEDIGRPDNALVCYVALEGSFQTRGPLPPGAANPIVHIAYELFDAQTGNLLMWGYGQ